ncbi:serine protease [Grimontia kaedaensis]|uniref:Serine protease n=1 Tax=Grimontia kaedaensis TaxID=2872157 RepID=A0ABY4WUN5_9GAMM|nr:serine protease [Grimontia kaedaensis]USH03302.1 serine protease [Grimontia kaedaensis]
MSQAFVRAAICFFSFISLQGCFLVNGPLDYAQETNAPSVSYLPIGIPFVLGGHGSSVPLTSELSLTAKHVAQLDYSDVIAYHPNCDVAVIKQSNHDKTIAPLGTVKTKGSVTTVGMGLTGKVLIGHGKYYLDVNFVDSDMFENCPASITDAPVQSGMSGGGAYNKEGELVGIISGMSGSGFRLLDGTELGNERTSIFVSTLHIRPWLLKVVEDFYDDSLNNLAASTITLSKTYLEEDLD